MKSRRNKHNKKNRTKRSKTGKKWITAISAAQKTLNKTGSFNKARLVFRAQALSNARKLFGAIEQPK
jgi:hypothetical protein